MTKLSQAVLNRRVFSQKAYDLHTTNFMLGQTPDYLSKDKVTLDIGGAAGIYSTWFCKHSKFVHAFEAVPEVYAQLRKLEPQFDNFQAHNLAMSDKIGTSSFFVDDKRLSNSSFQNLVNGIEIRVNTATVDSLAISDVGFIKVDTEGTELDVLHGAEQTIEVNRPTCMVEIYHKFNKYPVATSFEFFFDRGYSCYYNVRPNKGLHKVRDLAHAVEVANDESMVALHDGDFLFVYEE